MIDAEKVDKGLEHCTNGTGWNPGEYAYILKEYRRRENEWKGDSYSKAPVTPAAPVFMMPVAGGELLKAFSAGALVYNQTMGDWRVHNGVDFGGSAGNSVVAVADGTVTAVYDDSFWGTVVEIDHGNGVTAKYCGFNKDTLEIKKGATVEGGALLGYLGTIPCEKSDLSHLHFEVIKNGTNIDPEAYLNENGVTLTRKPGA